METQLFYADALLDKVQYVRALIDNGSQSYATISERAAYRLRLPKTPIEPRTISGVLGGMKGQLTHVIYFDLDVGGHKTRRVWAYIVPRLSEDLIFGRPWL